MVLKKGVSLAQQIFIMNSLCGLGKGAKEPSLTTLPDPVDVR